MPKIKTCRGAAKRFKTTGSGRIKRARPIDATSCRTRGASGNASSATPGWSPRSTTRTSAN
jgi:hypothetical protein